MATVFNFLFALLFLSLSIQGNCDCVSGQFEVSQVKIGSEAQGKPEWKVKITNPCDCSQVSLRLDCPGFQSAKPLDPWKLVKSGNACLVNGGNSVGPHSSFEFTYYWDTSFPLKPLDSEVACS